MTKIFKKVSIKHLLQIFVMILVIFIIIIPTYVATKPELIDCKIEPFDDGWTFTRNGQSYTNVKLSEFSFKITKKGEEIILENRFPANSHFDNPIVKFYSVHSVVDMYVEDELIYSYGRKYYAQGLLIGYGPHYVNLPRDYAGKKFKVKLIVTENDAFDGIQSLFIADGTAIFKKEVAERRISIIISMFLVLFGFITMGLSIVMLRSRGNFVQTFCIASVSVLMGFWYMCNTDIIFYAISDNVYKVYIEYISLYSLPLPFTYYFRERIREEKVSRVIPLYFWALVIAEVIFMFIAIVGQVINLVHFPMLLKFLHALIVMALVFIVFLSVEDIKQKRGNRNSISIGFIVAVLLIIFELVKYNLSKFFFGFQKNEYNSTLGFAILVIVISMLVDYALDISRQVYKSAEEKLLLQMAYVDELSGLANRRKCEEVLEEYKENEKMYAVISLDMNRLKYVNDNLGHDMGDAMIRKFSKMIKDVFGEYGTVGRMGGDEFIVILPEIDLEETNSLIAKMLKSMREKNAKDTKIQLSTAYGVATSEEVDLEDAHAAYRLADSRMYENKRLSKMQRTD